MLTDLDMERLGERDLYAVLDFLRAVGAASSMEEFREVVVSGLRRLIPCDVATYDEIDPHNGDVFWLTEPIEHLQRADGEAFLRNVAEHPMITYHARSGDGSPRCFSDFLSRRALHRTALYNEFFLPLELETQMAALFHGPSPAIVGVSLNGERRDFSERDRQVLDLVRPHLGQTYEAVLARARSDRMLRAVGQAADAKGSGVVLVSGDQRIAAASGTALARLQSYFGAAPRSDALPQPVLEWARDQRRRLRRSGPELPEPGRELRRGRGSSELRIRFLAGETPIEPDTLLLEEHRAPPSPHELRALGLTGRQSEVLSLIAAGKSNAEIAAELVISTLTVKKHAEHIYARLGVRSRIGAAARAYDVAGR